MTTAFCDELPGPDWFSATGKAREATFFTEPSGQLLSLLLLLLLLPLLLLLLPLLLPLLLLRPGCH